LFFKLYQHVGSTAICYVIAITSFNVNRNHQQSVNKSHCTLSKALLKMCGKHSSPRSVHL
jgi:hypothetical protein